MDLRELLATADVVDESIPSIDAARFSHLPIPGVSVLFKCRYYGLRYPTPLPVTPAHFVVDVDDPETAGWNRGSVTRVRDVNQAYAGACAASYGPSWDRLKLIAVTGTKGKTTTCHLLAKALENAGYRVGLASSLTLSLPSRPMPVLNTTPDPQVLHTFLRLALGEECTHVVIEASSIGIAEERLHGLRFAAVAFTNFGSDHIEFHGGRERYLQQKMRLFVDERFHTDSSVAVINVDDAAGERVAERCRLPVVRFGLARGDYVPASANWTSSESIISIAGQEQRAPLPGEHNAYNIVAACAIAKAAGVAQPDMFRGLQALPGRLQPVPSSLPLAVYVDYAHTPESVTAVLRCVRDLHGDRKIVAVVGCSGNSDRGKRPKMTRAAAGGADVTIITSDNPGDDNPVDILREMMSGTATPVLPIVERWAAIQKAIDLALPDGVVVLMGKGSESFQLVRGQRLPHSDFAIAKSVLDRIAEQADLSNAKP